MIISILIYWNIMAMARIKELRRSILNSLHTFVTAVMLVILNTSWRNGLYFFQGTPRLTGW